MIWLIAVYLFVVGLAMGSFALAMVDRMKAGKDWVKGRSECEYCNHKLAPKDLIPLLSWLSQGGKCRYCKKKLSSYYPLAEISVGVAFAASFLLWPVELSSGIVIAQFVIWLLTTVLMAALFVFDMRWYLLPSKLIYPAALLGVVYAGITVQQGAVSIISVLLSVLVGFGVFALLFIVSKGRWIGDGDVRFGIVMGLFAGGPLEVWFAIFAASLIGLIASLPLLLNTRSDKKDKKKKKSKMQLKIPFGPMLILGLYITVLFGMQFVEWYKADILLL